MKKILLYLTVLTSIFTFSVKANAETKTSSENKFVYDEVGEYLSGFGYDNSDEVSISQEYSVYNSEENTKLIFVKVDNKNVGAISISKDNKTAFLYGTDLLKEIDDESFSIVSTKNNVEIRTKSKIYSLYGKNKYCGVNKKNKYNNYKKIKYIDVTKDVNISGEKVDSVGMMEDNIVSGDYQTNFSYIGTHQKTLAKIKKTKNVKNLYMIPVKLMKNDEVQVGNAKYGMCWAAAGASIIQYKRGDISSYSTWENYNNLKKYYGGNPIGTIEWEKRMWDYHKLKMTYVDHRMSYKTVSNLMKNNKPVYCSFLHNESNTNNNYAHAVVLCGSYYRTDLDRYYYVYMDSNWADNGVYVVNHIWETEMNSDTGSNFYYNPGDGTIYNNWRYSFY